MSGTRALLFLSIQKQKPAANKHQAMFGNVTKSRLRLPNLSIDQMAGNAKMNVINPNPMETSRHSFTVYPASAKIVEE